MGITEDLGPHSRLHLDALANASGGVPRSPPEHLHFVSFEHVDHPLPRRRESPRRLSSPIGLRRSDQNCRNPQHLSDEPRRGAGRRLGLPSTSLTAE